jgi:hypothetical protein
MNDEGGIMPRLQGNAHRGVSPKSDIEALLESLKINLSDLGEVPKAEGVESGLPAYSPVILPTRFFRQESFRGGVLSRVEVLLW